MEKEKKQELRTFSILALTSLSSLLVFLTFTQPSSDNFSFSLIPLVLLWLTIFSSVGLLMKYLINRSVLKKYRVASTTIATTTVFVVMFSALGQLQVFDTLLLVVLMALGVFYFSRTWRK